MKLRMRGPLADSIDTYLAHKRSLGKQLITVGQDLRRLDDYLHTQKVLEIEQITSAHWRSAGLDGGSRTAARVSVAM